MTAYRLDVVFTGIDHDDETLDLIETIPYVHWVFQERVMHAIATITSKSALDAAIWLVDQVTERVPSARPFRLDRDLVSVPDIAERVGVTREAVRHWATGTRRASGCFPPTCGTVGGNIRVWPWAVVNAWLEANLGLGDGFEYPSDEDAARIDLVLQQSARLLEGVEQHSHWTILARTEFVPIRSFPLVTTPFPRTRSAGASDDQRPIRQEFALAG